MSSLNKNKKYVFACYSDTLKADFKKFCGLQGYKPDFVLRSLMFYFLGNYANVVSVLRDEKFTNKLYSEYSDLLDAPLIKRFMASDNSLEDKI